MKYRLLIIISLLLSSLLRAESSQSYQFLASGGSVSVSAYGGMSAPTYLYKSIAAGQINPFLLINMQQHLMSECVEKVLKNTPDQKTSFITAHGAFANGVCRISKCFQQMLTLDYLAQSSSNPKANGGQTSSQAQDGSKDVALMLYQASAKSGCDSKGNTDGGTPSENVDPNLLPFLQ